MKTASSFDLCHTVRSALGGYVSRTTVGTAWTILMLIAVVSPTVSVVAAPPKVIKATPNNGETNVDPMLKEMRIKFDQDMSPTSMSVVGGGPTFPGDTTSSKKPRWVDPKTFVFPIRLRPNQEYKLSINSDRFRGFQSQAGEPAEPYPIQFKTGGFKTPAPKVIKAVPDNGDTDVDPNLKELVVEFDQDMLRDSHSWVASGQTSPKDPKKRPRWLNLRTCVLPIQLKPDHEYRVSVNSKTSKNFRNKIGQPAAPYLIVFKTAKRKTATTEATPKAGPASIPGLAKGWSEEKRLVTAQSLQLFYPAVAARGNDVFVAYREGAVKVIVSHDGGKAWGSPVVVSGDLKINSAPSVVSLGNKVVVVWPSIVERDKILALQLHSAHSSDGGRTWSKPRRITQNIDDCQTPRLLPTNGGLIIVWQQTPVKSTLGGVDLNKRADWTPDSIQPGLGKLNTGSIAGSGLNVRVTISSCFYDQNDDSFTPPRRIGEVFARRMPNVFQLYGPEDGNVFLTYNKDAEVKTFVSADRGQTWSPHFAGTQYFNPHTLISVVSTPEGRRSAWIRRAPYQAIPINFRDSSDRPSVSLTAPYYVRSAPNLAISDKISHVVWAAGRENTSWISYMRTDDIRPTTRITAPTSPHITGPKIQFTWKGNDNISETGQLSYSHTIDKRPWSPFSKKTFVNIDTPVDGEYLFRIRAMDVAGNIQKPPTEFKFDSFGAGPDTQITGVQLNTTTTLKPNDFRSTLPTINQRSCRVLFTGKDNTQKANELTYAVQLDDGPWSQFTSQQSHEFKRLPNGKHIFRVRAKDARDNIDASPAKVSLIVKIGLEVRFVKTPPKYTNSREITFSWKGLDNTGSSDVQFSYFSRLDNGPAQKHGSETQTVLTDLDERRHTFTVWAVDPAGNRAPEDSFDFVVDRTPPDTSAQFEHRWSAGGFPIITLEGTDPPIGDSGESRSVRLFQYHFGDGAWQDLPMPGGKDWIVNRKIPFYSWGFLATVRAVDLSGNFDPTPAVVNLTLFKRYTATTYAIVGGVAGVIILALLWLLLRGRSRRRPAVPAPSPLDAYSTALGETEETETSSESNSEEKSDNPYDF